MFPIAPGIFYMVFLLSGMLFLSCFYLAYSYISLDSFYRKPLFSMSPFQNYNFIPVLKKNVINIYPFN